MSSPKINTAQPGEFTLVFNTNNGVVHPVGLQKEQHALLQAVVSTLACYIKEDTVTLYVPNPNYQPVKPENDDISDR